MQKSIEKENTYIHFEQSKRNKKQLTTIKYKNMFNKTILEEGN